MRSDWWCVQQADAVHHQITGGNRNAAANFVRDLQAGLETVGRLQIRVDIIGQCAGAGGGDLSGGEERDGRRGGVRADGVDLAEAAGEGRYAGIGLLGVWLIVAAGPLGGLEYLPDAA